MSRVHAAHVEAFRPQTRPHGGRRRAAPVRDFRARGKLKVVRAEAAPVAEAERDVCRLCDGTIDRFDRETWLASGRCCGCDSTLRG